LDYKDAEGNRKQVVAKNAVTKTEAQIALIGAVKREFAKEHNIKGKERIRLDEFAKMYLENYAKVNKSSWNTDESYLKGIRKLLRKDLDWLMLLVGYEGAGKSIKANELEELFENYIQELTKLASHVDKLERNTQSKPK